MRGHWRTERSETTGALRPVAMRPGTTWSVLLAVFGSADSAVTLARVFWLRAGAESAPQEFGVVAEGELTVAGDLSGFGGDPRELARRLADRDGVTVCTDPAQYARVSRARLGIDADAARLLGSAAPAGDLDAVVREHVLQPTDARRWIDRLAGSVEDLTRAHATWTTTRDQLAALDPVLADADQLSVLTEQLGVVHAELLALPDWADRWRDRLLSVRATRLRAEVTAADRELVEVQDRLDDVRDRVQAAVVQRAGHGGDALAPLETKLRDLAGQRRERRGRADVLDRLLETAGLERVSDEHGFRARREQAASASARARETVEATADRLAELDGTLAGLAGQLAATEAEREAVRVGSATVPPALHAVREQLAAELGVPATDLPVAGELLQVTDPVWLPAVVSVLGDLPGSLLVPARHAAAVAGLAVAHHVLPDRLPTTAPLAPARSLAAVLAVADSPVAAWLEAEVLRRAPHTRAHTDTEFARTPVAVTRDGRVRDTTGRRPAVVGPVESVLTWSAADRDAALTAQVALLQEHRDAVLAERAATAAEQAAAVVQDRQLARVELFADWRDVDWRSSVEAIAETRERLAQLARKPLSLARDEEALADLRMDVAKLEAAQADALQRRGTAAGARDEVFRALGVVRRRLGTDVVETVLDHAAALLGAEATSAQRLDRRAGVAFSPLVDTDDVDERERQLRAALDAERAGRSDAHARVAQQVVTGLTTFLLAHPDELAGVSASVTAVADVRALRDRLRRTELPAAATVVGELLADRVVRDLASFLAELDRRADRVHSRIRAVDEVLFDLDVEPGRHLHLTVRPSTSLELAAFRAQLRACADVVGSRWAVDDERTTDLVSRITGLVSRLATDDDWAQRVTDVGTWSVVTVSEHWRADGTEVVASARPGDRDRRAEQHAATVLTATTVLARGADGLGLLVLDRVPPAVARTVLELGDRWDLQVLLVAPPHEVAALEPFVGAVGQVVDPDGNDARLRNVRVSVAAGT